MARIDSKRLEQEEINKIIFKQILESYDMQLDAGGVYDENGNETKVIEDWKNLVIDVSKIPLHKFSDKPNLTFWDAREFTEMKDGDDGHLYYYSDLNFYAYKYRQINGFHPGVYRFEDYFNISSFVSNLFKHYEVPLNSYNKTTYQGEKELKVTSILICFSKTFVLYIDGVNRGMLYYDPVDEQDKDSILYTVLGLLRSVKNQRSAENKIYVVYRTSSGFEKTGFEITKVKVDLEENYNEGFIDVSEKIVSGLNDKNKTYLVMLRGEPGVGKCVVGDTKIKIRNKKTRKIEEINIADLM